MDKDNVCKGCLRYLESEQMCRGWLSPQGCNPVYNPALYHKEITEMINHYKTRASAGATSRLIAEWEPELCRLERMMYEGLQEAYQEDKNRGTGGGQSESDSNAAASRKAKMKDNRYLDTKMTKEEREHMKQAYTDWEEEVGEKLETISPYSLTSRSKIDSYTGDVIPDTKPKKKRIVRRKKVK